MMPANTNNMLDNASLLSQLKLIGGEGEEVWIEVVQKMESMYAELVHHQVELEEKNIQLEQMYQQLQTSHEELQRTQRQLVQAEKMSSLGRLTAGVAHELNNPISFIQGNTFALQNYKTRFQGFFSELNASDDVNLHDLKEKYKIVDTLHDLTPLVEGTMEGVSRVSDIVNSLLSFTTPQPRQPEEFDLCQLIHTACDWIIKSAETKPVIYFDLPDTCYFIGYENSVHHILVNLIQNAIDACMDNPTPKIWLQLSANEKLQLKVIDNGNGILADHQSKLFDPFFTTKEVGKGTGLGLYICYLLATEQCKGTIEAHNWINAGKIGGAEFRVSLPWQLSETKQ